MKSYSETQRPGNLSAFEFKKKVSNLINETVNEFNNRYFEMNKNLLKFKNDFLNKMTLIQEIIDNSNSKSNYYQIKTEGNVNNKKKISNKILKKKNNNNNILKNLSFGHNTSFNIYSSSNSTKNNQNINNNKKYNNLVNKPFDLKSNKKSIKYSFIKSINNSIEKHLKNQNTKKKNVSFINYNYYNNHKNIRYNTKDHNKKKNNNINSFSNFSNKQNEKEKRPHSLNKININKHIKEFLLSTDSLKINLNYNKIKALEILCNKTNFLTKIEKIHIKYLNKDLYKNIILNDEENEDNNIDNNNNDNNNIKKNFKFPSKTCQIGMNFMNKKKEEKIFNDQSEISKNVIKIIYYLFNVQNKFNISNNSKDLYEFIFNINNVKNIKDLFFNVIYDKIYNKCEVFDENFNEFHKEISQNKEMLNLIIQTNNSPLCWIVMNLLEIDEYLELIILNN